VQNSTHEKRGPPASETAANNSGAAAAATVRYKEDSDDIATLVTRWQLRRITMAPARRTTLPIIGLEQTLSTLSVRHNTHLSQTRAFSGRE